MRLDNGAIYAPDLLAFPVGYSGDPAINGIAGNQTIETLADVWAGGGNGVMPAQDMASRFASTSPQPTSGASSQDDPCAKWTGWQYWLCKGTDIGTGGIGGNVYNQGQQTASNVTSFGSGIVTRAGLFALALLVLGLGLWAILK